MNQLLLFWGMLFYSYFVWSCDICGGVGSNATIGLFASNRFHTAGLRIQQSQFTTFSDGYIHSTEFLTQGEVNARFQLGKKWQLFLFQPYQIALQKRLLGQTALYGLGDPTVIGNATLIDRKDSNHVTRLFLTMGGGVKFPVGRKTTSKDPLRNLYPGSGSFEFLFIQSATHRPLAHCGWQAENSFALKTKNLEGFANGHSWQLTGVWFWDLKLAGYRLFPALGFSSEHFWANRSNQTDLSNVDGKGLRYSGRAQVSLFTRRFLFNLGGNIPIFQNINSGQTLLNYQISLSGQYIIPLKNKKS
jgi:hypothetical protein